MTTADIQQLQYAFSKAQERNEELAALLKASNASNDALVEMVLKHEATIARLTAERQGMAAEVLRLIDTNGQYMDIMGKQAEVRDRVFASYQEAQKTNATLLRERDELAARLAAIGQHAGVTEVTK